MVVNTTRQSRMLHSTVFWSIVLLASGTVTAANKRLSHVHQPYQYEGWWQGSGYPSEVQPTAEPKTSAQIWLHDVIQNMFHGLLGDRIPDQ